MNAEPRLSLGSMTVGGIVASAAIRFPNREALLCAGTGRRFTFRQLNERTNRLANALTALPLERGSVVAFICSNRAEILEIYVALAKSGLVGLPLNYRLAPAELESLINAIGAVALFCEARFGSVLGHLDEHCPALAHTIWIGDRPPDSCKRYEDLLSLSPPTAPEVDIDEQAPYYFNLTSGTTGLPKAYVLTQYSASALLGGVVSQDVRSDDVSLVVFPVFGRVGFANLMLAMTMGARSVMVNFDVEATLRLIQEESVTIVWLVPTMAALLLQVPSLDSHRLDSLRYIGFVGSMLPAALRERAMQRLCPNIYEGYGLQESGMLTMSTPEDRRRAPDSVGKPVLFAEVRVVDPLGKPVAVGEIGEIVGRSPHCITEYYQSPTKNAEAFRNGWFHSGDLGRFDADGYLYICGRVKDMIISGGQNVHSAEIEATLIKLGGILDCAVVGLPHEIWGEVVTAVIVTVEGASLSAVDVQEFCRTTLASFKVPRIVLFQNDPLPRTPTGKVQKFRLVERYRAREPA
jgi:fatty-acyl-CoA synthase